MNKATLLIDKLMLYYNCTTLEALGEHLGIKQSSISSWKIRNSVVGIKKKCISLGIYDEIFKDFNFENNELDINEILLLKIKEKANKYGLSLKDYLEHLIINDLEKTEKD